MIILKKVTSVTKIGLKLWSTNIDNYIKPAQVLYEKHIFDFIELYIVPDTLDNLKIWSRLKIPFSVHMAHSAHNVDLSNPQKFEFNKKIYAQTKKYADMLNAEMLIVHGGTGGDFKECASQIKRFSDKRILIENKPHITLPFVNAEVYTGSTIESIEYIKEYACCGFCLDIGHAICSANSHREDPYNYIEKFLELSPSCIHLSDIYINTELDEHLNYGLGELDFKKIKNLVNSKKTYVIETNKNSKENLDDFEHDAKFLRRILEEG